MSRVDKFTRAEKRDLNRLFGLPARIGSVTITRLSREQNFDNPRGFIAFWRDMLNDARREESRQLTEQRRLRRNERQRQRRQNQRFTSGLIRSVVSNIFDNVYIRNVVNSIFDNVYIRNVVNTIFDDVIEKNTAYTLPEIGDKVQRRREGQVKTPFKLILRSYLNPDIQREYTFKNLYHFNNWERAVYTLATYANSDSTGVTYESILEKDDAFKFSTYEVQEIEGGGGSKNSNALKSLRKFKGEYQIFTVRQVPIQHNNCGLECLKHLLNLDASYSQMRKIIGSRSQSLISLEQLERLYKHYKNDKKLAIYDIDSQIIPSIDDDNILYHKEHYYVILSSQEINYETEDKVKRGVIFWDIETRQTEDFCYVGSTKSYYIKDVILHAHVRRYKSDDYEHYKFTTKKDGLPCLSKSSCRQFLDFLKSEGRQGRYYYLYAHNGGNFDVYFLIMNFNEQEKDKYTPSLRGTSIIKLEYGNNIFLDTYCFLTYPLHKLSEGFKVQVKKLQSFNVNGQTLTNEQMCFYKPLLTFNEFLDLKDREPEFWALYNDYCYTDCVALQQIWDAFSASIEKLINVYIENAPHRKRDLLKKCCLRQSCTVGGHAQKILNALNGLYSKKSYDFLNFEKFIDTKEKHDFVMNNFKRGGISHCHQKGKHTEGVMSVDICSQYPASMISMKIPSGYSSFVYEYIEGKHGFYLLKNIKFDCNYTFKPVCEILKSGVLNWSTGDTLDTIALDTYMIDYLKKYYGLMSFEVVRGLVSNYEIEGEKLFGVYVRTLFQEKAEQDAYKDLKDVRYNNAYRETVKLYLNSITGKLVMNREKYTSLKPANDTMKEFYAEYHTSSDIHAKLTIKSYKSINGSLFVPSAKKENMNEWITAGVMVYSYSKRLLFEYIRQMPNNSDDVIHVETDSIYYPIKCHDKFTDNISKYDGSYPAKFGKDLGNIKVEKKTTQTCYFLGKKIYAMYDDNSGKWTFVYKGIPQSTLSDDGKRIQILDLKKYEAVFNHKQDGEPIEAEFMTLKRTLFGNTSVSSHRQKRRMNSSYDYKTW